MATCAFVVLGVCGRIPAQLRVDEQRRIRCPDPSMESRYRRPSTPAPVTVASPDIAANERLLPLDEAIGMALRYSEVMRVLTGTAASSSGLTIYDTAIATTAVDRSVGRFDPVFLANSAFRHNETPFAAPDPGDPLRALIRDRAVGGTDVSAALSQQNRFGGTAEMALRDRWDRTGAGPPGSGSLDPTHSPSFELSYTQPLLEGFGRLANNAPIVIARLQADQSYFQFKDSVQGCDLSSPEFYAAFLLRT